MATVEDVLQTKPVFLDGLDRDQIIERLQMFDSMMRVKLNKKIQELLSEESLESRYDLVKQKAIEISKFIGLSAHLQCILTCEKGAHHIVLHDERYVD